MDHDRRRELGVAAATAAAAEAGLVADAPTVLQATNNIVVWLRPHPVVAKVGTWPHSAANLGREAEICASLDARIARPLHTDVHVDPTSGFAVTLWHRLEALPLESPKPAQMAVLLGGVHGALRHLDVELPRFTEGLALARATLFDDDAMHLLAPDDLAFVREQFDRLRDDVVTHGAPEQPLHGEPHLGNVVTTDTGPHLVDFETVCTGPLEWDLASVPPATSDCFANVDADLLARCRLLNRARVVTWCWNLGDFPDMREHGDLHLRLLHRDADSVR